MKGSNIQSFRFKLALYVFLSCGLTLLTDLGALFAFYIIQMDIRGWGHKIELIRQIDRMVKLLQQAGTGLWIFLGVISIIFFFLYYIVLSAPMVSYMREIVNGVERIKNGDLNMAVPIRYSGELTDLARAINAMQAELKTAIDKEREAEQVKDELITNVAHDLRTPLTSVIGYLKLLQDQPDMDAETVGKYVHIAYEKAARMEGLVTDLFDFTRYEKNKIVITRQRLDMKQFMEQMIDEFYPSLNAQHLECYTIFPPEKVYIDGDGELLFRAFGNLMGNAIKYGAEGKQIRVEINQFPGSRQVRVAITNYGRIIPRKELDKVFDKFYRADTARSTEGGTGLGLAIAKNIFEMHNGTIQARSDERGTVFEVVFQLS